MFRNGRRLQELLKRFDAVTRKTVQVSVSDYIFALREVSQARALEYGRRLHLHILLCGVTPSTMLENVLIDMYSKCGSLHDAYSLFMQMPVCNIFSWTAIITAYVKENKGYEAVELFCRMRCQGITPDKYVIVVVLKACAAVKALEQGRCIHGDALACCNTELDCFLCSALVDMYAKCERILDARNVFDNIKVCDVICWNAMISGYAQQGPEKEALFLFEEMQKAGVKGSDVTCAFVIKACSFLKNLEYGKQVHAYIIHFGLSSSVFVANSLLDMYVKCGCFLDAQNIFIRMPDRDVISWTTVMAAFVQRGMGGRALMLYKEVLERYLVPNGVTFLILLNACAQEGLFIEGRQLHGQIVEMGLPLDTFIGSSLVDMYAKCGSVDDAYLAFMEMPKQELVSWNAVINGCSQQGLHEKANLLFTKMIQMGLEPNESTFASIIKVSASPQALEEGRMLHAFVVERALEDDVFVGSTLVDMYAKCESIKDACLVFKRIQKHDTAIWNTFVTAYVQQGFEEEAVLLFDSMKGKKIGPNEITFTIILKACTMLMILEWGRALHSEILMYGYELSLVIRSSLLNMYIDCGDLSDARNLFEKTYPRDVIAWTTLIAGCALQGCGKETLDLFEKMRGEEQPNEITFIGVLCGCSHTGLLDEACWLFALMVHYYCVVPVRDHFACIIDLLSRAGLLELAFLIARAMPISTNEVLWMSLLSVCRVFGNVDVAKQVSTEAFLHNLQNSTAFVQLSNIYAEVGTFSQIEDEIRT